MPQFSLLFFSQKQQKKNKRKEEIEKEKTKLLLNSKFKIGYRFNYLFMLYILS